MADKKPYFVNVNSHIVKSNINCALGGTGLAPVFAVREGRGGKVGYAHSVMIRDDKGVAWGQLMYEPFGGLSCGARVFLVCKEPPETVGVSKPRVLKASAEALEDALDPVPTGLSVLELLARLQVLAKQNPHAKVQLDRTTGYQQTVKRLFLTQRGDVLLSSET